MTSAQQGRPHLAGNYAPVGEELTAYDLPVTGRIPAELAGWYLRNGPNPADAASGHWFFGDGMIHGVRLEGGRAVSYRNRWVRTRSFTDGARAYDDQGHRDLTVGPANTHVIRHAGRTLALVETALPYELARDLDTVGAYDFGGKLSTAMTAHPKVCPVTGELHFFGYGTLEAPYLTYHRADASGELMITRPVEVPGPTMMHDFNLTAEHVVFMDLPVVFDLDLAMAGTMPYHWDDAYGARLGVLRRNDPYGEVRWFGIDPCYVFHPLNAYDALDGTIVLHVMRYPELWRRTGDVIDRRQEAVLWKWTIDPATGTVHEEQCDDRPGEFPRVDDRLTGLDAAYGHVTCGSSLVRYELGSGAATAHDFGPRRTPGEAAFAPAGDAAGGPGWLMTYVYDAGADRSDLVILDAGDLAAGPVATIHLPARVPYGFHGNWLAD
ncbi:carotenoid oxygenase family protein [Streptomyces rhizosphaerihabitans]|uniref:carotenoid oxygenase family protein n=1 Tax=Streptomyces rhizosphaerihabitans TaxID=1266770 RepID=UPI0021C1472D|nr:carotenoid oxygenase family protein [Streptomyces rhizosphaerihabitans]MCT9003606.1 carotenoid oxygenase family protein [Streptomyces rhizosphaerihabitans]